MRIQFLSILTIVFLFNTCAHPVKKYHQGLSTVWQNEKLNWNATSLLLLNGYLYGSSLDKTIFRADFLTGEIDWKSKSLTNYSNQKPLIVNNQIFIGGSDVLNAYNLSGELIWSHQTNKKVGHSIIHFDSLVFGSLTNKGLMAFNINDGSLMWSLEPDYQMLSSNAPSIQDSLIAISNFDYSLAEHFSNTKLINAKSGKSIWSRRDSSSGGEALFYQNKLLICYDSAYVDGAVLAIDLESGATLWEVSSNPEIYLKPALIWHSLLIASYERGLDCLDPNNGELKWTLANKKYAPATEFIAFNGLTYFGTQGRQLIGVDSLGKIQFESDFEYGIGTPVLFENGLYITDGNDALFKLEEY